MTYNRMLSTVKRTMNVYTDGDGVYFTVLDKWKSSLTGKDMYIYGVLYAQDKDMTEDDVLDFMCYNDACDDYDEETRSSYYFMHDRKEFVVGKSEKNLEALDDMYMTKTSKWRRARHGI